MYHTITYMLTTGRLTKKKHPSPEPSNEVACIMVKAFDNWRIGRAWTFYFHNRYERMAEKNKSKKTLSFD